jgi:hypothetical protein
VSSKDTARYLGLIRELDMKVDKLIKKMNSTADEELKNQYHKQALEMSHEKIFIAHQLEESLRTSLKNIKNSIGDLKTVVYKNKPKIDQPMVSQQKAPAKVKQNKKKNKTINEYDEQLVQQQVYCTCKKPKADDLIGCDSDTCKVEWFHIECVGLKEVPTGQWFCDECKQEKNIL